MAQNTDVKAELFFREMKALHAMVKQLDDAGMDDDKIKSKIGDAVDTLFTDSGMDTLDDHANKSVLQKLDALKTKPGPGVALTAVTNKLKVNSNWKAILDGESTIKTDIQDLEQTAVRIFITINQFIMDLFNSIAEIADKGIFCKKHETFFFLLLSAIAPLYKTCVY